MVPFLKDKVGENSIQINKGDNWYTDRLHRFLLTKNVSLKTVNSKCKGHML